LVVLGHLTGERNLDVGLRLGFQPGGRAANFYFNASAATGHFISEVCA
jgi:hypothetical protein